MADRVIRIDGTMFRLVATIDEGQTLYFAAGREVAVEKFDMRIGSSEFDFQVNSRAVRGGQPEAVMAMQSGMDNEFMEARVKSNLYGLPINLGNLTEMARQQRIELSYGELKPQVFRSAITSRPVAWRVWFKRTWYTGAASGRGYTASSKPGVGARAVASASGSARIGAGSAAGAPGVANGRVGPLGNDAGLLRIYVKQDDQYQVYSRPFDDHDAIFRPRTLVDHLGSLVRGRGW